MHERTRAERNARYGNPGWLDTFENAAGPWHETPDEVRAALAWGERKRRLLQWVRGHMETRLTARERECVRLYYFQGFTYEVIGRVTGTHRSSVCRAIHRGLRKLRAARDADPSWRSIVSDEAAGCGSGTRASVSLPAHCPAKNRLAGGGAALRSGERPDPSRP